MVEAIKGNGNEDTTMALSQHPAYFVVISTNIFYDSKLR